MVEHGEAHQKGLECPETDILRSAPFVLPVPFVHILGERGDGGNAPEVGLELVRVEEARRRHGRPQDVPSVVKDPLRRLRLVPHMIVTAGARGIRHSHGMTPTVLRQGQRVTRRIGVVLVVDRQSLSDLHNESKFGGAKVNGRDEQRRAGDVKRYRTAQRRSAASALPPMGGQISARHVSRRPSHSLQCLPHRTDGTHSWCLRPR
mmetsp:Transcript_19521/g.54894  ORF Transcript_19521/g.54894 Transcript_19521/m.54894 type:complete len:205 (+) Transcript_19521:2002-2616(+)